MIAIDREPTADIISVSSKIPEAFNKAFEGEPLSTLDPKIKDTSLIGRNRFFSKLSLGFNRIGKDSLDRLKRGGRSRRCGNCRGRHSTYEKCQNGGLLRLNQLKSFSFSSGFR